MYTKACYEGIVNFGARSIACKISTYLLTVIKARIYNYVALPHNCF